MKLMLAADSRVQFCLYGGDCSEFQGESRVHALGIMSVDECAKLYARCSIGISISASNPSRLPFEMMASGLSVMEISKENNTCDFSTDAMVFAKPSAEGIASAVLAVPDDSESLARMSDAGLRFMKNRDIAHENEMFHRGLRSYIELDDAAYLPDVFVHDLESVPVADELAHLQDELDNASCIDLAQGQTPVCARSITVDLDAVAPAGRVLKVALWARSDQSDLCWAELHKSAKGSYCVAGLPDDLDEALLYVHFYSFDLDGRDPLFLGAVEQLVTSHATADGAGVARVCNIGAYKATLTFSGHSFDSSRDISAGDAAHRPAFVGNLLK